ncbi:hypothetical protein [Pandoraea pneumonica]|uniref:hypothetical protein n=1 Tax=Pandoraea pneumonica TaxID=2508299 RepID=UPI003CEB8459
MANGGKLIEALTDQRQYFNATGVWVPILKAALSGGEATSFGFDERDQLYDGYAVAQHIAARYDDTSVACPDGRASFYCNGVVLRITGWGDKFHSWNPSQTSINALGVSFSYARADMLMTRLISGRGDAGMIVREFAAPVQRPLTFRCIYPRDAGTGTPDRCLNGHNPTCASLGVTTPQGWITWFNQSLHCNFAPDAQSVDVSTKTRAYIPESNRFWNEAIIGVWPQDVPEEIPFEAIFYVGDGLGGAQFVQRDYLQTTGRFMPLLHVDLTQSPGARAFTYNPTEQSFTLNGALDAPPPPDTKWQPGPR